MELLDLVNQGNRKKRISLRQCMELHPRDAYVIRTIAQETLGEYYEPLKHFYLSVLQSYEYPYVAYVARRSIGLAELFFIVLWDEASSGWERELLEEGWARATTDSTILSYAGQIAKEVAQGLQPKILIVDDMLIQGNGLNELLLGIEKSVLQHLKNDDAVFAWELWTAVVNTISIRIFAQNEDLSLVKLQYQQKLKPQFKMEPKKWHDLSRRISNMITATAMANATFIMGAEMDATRFGATIQTLPNGVLQLDAVNHAKLLVEEKDTLHERYYLGYSGGSEDEIKYYCSLRIIKNCYTDGFRIMPFVFLPQLTQDSYLQLKARVFEKWGLSQDNMVLCPDAEATRLEYEAMVLHLSESLLTAWMDMADITLKQQDFDPGKVILNYALNRHEPMMDADEFLRLMNPEYLFDWEELNSLLKEVTADAAALRIFTSNAADDMKKKLEDLVYHMKIQELTESYRSYSFLPPVERDGVIPPLIENRKTNWNISLNRFIARATVLISDIAPDKFFGYILSFMDEGIITLKARKSGNRFTQVLRMGEQSLFLWPKRYERYLPVLLYILEYAERSAGSVQNYLWKFLYHAKESGELESDIDVKDLTEELMCYLNSLKDSGQRLEDWDIDFSSPAVLDRENKQWVERVGMHYFDNQIDAIIETGRKRSLFNACLEFYPN